MTKYWFRKLLIFNISVYFNVSAKLLKINLLLKATIIFYFRRPTQRNRSMEVTDLDDEDEVTNEAAQQTKNKWPHLMSRSLCTTFCTLGLFNISRFAVFSIHFGANFLVQFLILSFIFGIPMLWLQMCLGSKIKGGIVTMWRISKNVW